MVGRLHKPRMVFWVVGRSVQKTIITWTLIQSAIESEALITDMLSAIWIMEEYFWSGWPRVYSCHLLHLAKVRHLSSGVILDEEIDLTFSQKKRAGLSKLARFLWNWTILPLHAQRKSAMHWVKQPPQAGNLNHVLSQSTPASAGKIICLLFRLTPEKCTGSTLYF